MTSLPQEKLPSSKNPPFQNTTDDQCCMALKGSIATTLRIFHLNLQVLLWAFLRKNRYKIGILCTQRNTFSDENTLKEKHQREEKFSNGLSQASQSLIISKNPLFVQREALNSHSASAFYLVIELFFLIQGHANIRRISGKGRFCTSFK